MVKRKRIGRKRKYSSTGGSTTRGRSKTTNYSPSVPPQARMRTNRHKKSIRTVATDLTGEDLWRTRRMAIYVMWRDTYDCPEPSTWKGKDGIIYILIEALNMPRGSYKTILKVLQDIWQCHVDAVEYTGNSRQVGCQPRHQPMIQSGSVEEQIVGDAVEDNIGFTATMELVNSHVKVVSIN